MDLEQLASFWLRSKLSDTWESRENLENVGDLLRGFKEQYGRDDREVR